MSITTKDRILQEALRLFSENGYTGSNLRDLAARLNLSKSALYKHFAGKEAIWNAIIDRLEPHYAAHMHPENRPEGLPLSLQALLEITMDMFCFTLHDRQIAAVRRLIASEQFRDPRIGQLATEHFLLGPQRTFTDIFRRMMEAGILKQTDPARLALLYTAPVSALIHLCDREPHREPEVMEQLRAYVPFFFHSFSTQPTEFSERE